jgi:hypothetical protein
MFSRDKIETTEYGWDCVPQLREASAIIDRCKTFQNEINNCVRDRDLDLMVIAMVEHLADAIEVLKEIDCNVEWVTVDDDE